MEPRRVVITGAASGIGRAAAIRFAESGHELILVDRSEDQLGDVTESLSSARAVISQVCDISIEQQVGTLFARIAELRSIDSLILCAGVTSDGLIESTTEHDWSYILATNLTGAFLCLKYAAPLLRAGREPSVVAVGSISARVIGAGGGCAAYEASKAGLVQLIRAFAVEHAPDGIRANVVSPGRVRTNLGVHARELRASVYTSDSEVTRPRHQLSAPLRFEAAPAEIADVMYFLSSAQASFITGADLVADGGYTTV